MNPPRLSRSWLRMPELWLFVLGLLVHLWVLGGFSQSPYFLPKSGDTKFYNDWALRILEGQWTDGNAFYGLPGYAFALAGIYRLVGFDPFVIGLLQTVMMALIPVVMLRLARLSFSQDASNRVERSDSQVGVIVGVIGGLAWIFFRPAQAFSTVLMPTIWLVLAYWACVFWAAKTRTATVWRPWLLMGLCVGLISMLVATILFALPLMFVAIVRSVANGTSLRRKCLAVVCAASILVAGVFVGAAPAWIHNFFVAKDPVFLSAHGGLNFYIGNHSDANGYPKPPRGLRGSQEGLLKDSIIIPEAQAGRKLKRTEVSRYWSEKAKAWIHEHPKEWFQLLGVKFRNFWNAFQYDDIGAVSLLHAAGILPPGIGFGIAAALGLPGLIWGLWGVPRARWIAAAVLLHMAALMPVFVTERYRLAAVPGLLLLGAFWLWQGWDWLAAKRWRCVSSWIVATLLALWFVTIPQRDLSALTLDDYNVGVAALEGGDLEVAERSLVRAYQYVPDNAETNFALGNLWLAKGDAQRAKQAYRRALQLNPRDSSALSNLGVIAMQQKSWSDAEKLFRASIAVEPEDAKTYYLLALTRYEAGRMPEAKEAIDTALSLNPKQPQFLELRQKIVTAEERSK